MDLIDINTEEIITVPQSDDEIGFLAKRFNERCHCQLFCRIKVYRLVVGRYRKGQAIGSRFIFAENANIRASTNASILNANLDKIHKFTIHFKLLN